MKKRNKISLVILAYLVSCYYQNSLGIVFNQNSNSGLIEMVKHIKFTKQNMVYNVTATMYNAVEAQCDSDPLITAGMYKINPRKASQHKWVALSRDLLKRWGGRFTYGDVIRIENAGDKSGVYTVVDTMNARFKNKIDILETQGTDLYKYENVKIVKII